MIISFAHRPDDEINQGLVNYRFTEKSGSTGLIGRRTIFPGILRSKKNDRVDVVCSSASSMIALAPALIAMSVDSR